MASIGIDFAHWTVADFEKFQEATRKQELDVQVELMVKAITRWDFEVEVSYDNLLDMPYTVIENITAIFSEMFQAMLNESVAKGFVVDLKNVKVKHFIKYQKAVSNFDLEPVYNMIDLVVEEAPKSVTQRSVIGSLDDLREISVEDFFQYIRAIGEAFTNKQNAKNS